MVVPDIPQSLQEHLSLLTLHCLVTGPGRERRENLGVGEVIKIFSDKLINSVVEHCALLVQDHVVREPVVFLER
jgi:hypothetical protein